MQDRPVVFGLGVFMSIFTALLGVIWLNTTSDNVLEPLFIIIGSMIALVLFYLEYRETRHFAQLSEQINEDYASEFNSLEQEMLTEYEKLSNQG